MSDSAAIARRSIEILSDLVAFDTTSRDSNLALIEYVEAMLGAIGVPSRRVPNAEGTKANLIATIGPDIEGGVVLSGHTDVVPVDGQPWTSDPFTLTDKGDGRLYGRGTCDMKGFLALALAIAPDLAKAPLKKPVHLAFSYDEEIGCLGAPHLIRDMVAATPSPSLVVVGEPTSMEAVRGHKSVTARRVIVSGHEAHSSATHLGVSANVEAVRLMARLIELADRLEREGDPASPFLPRHATLTIGKIHGGTAGNILARECQFIFDLRCIPGMKPDEVLQPFYDACTEMDAAIKARAPDGGVVVERLSDSPPLFPVPDGEAEVFVRRLTGDNGPPRVVSYGAEAGQFQEAGFATVICGPGSIDQAHQPDEYVDITQMERGAQFMVRMLEALV